jgi:ribulose-phosphate 3-epimerase
MTVYHLILLCSPLFTANSSWPPVRIREFMTPPQTARAHLEPIIAPSLLACDFSKLGQELRDIQSARATWAHFDVMDGTFVPNISIGLPILEACRRSTTLILDVHLMVQQPERYLEAFAKAGADVLTVHAEATPHAHRCVQIIKDLGKKAGLAINPATPISALEPLLPDLDLALVMSVNPGFGGQRFIASSLDRLSTLRTMRDALNPGCFIEVDGGVNVGNIAQIAAAGADVLVAGSAVFGPQGAVYHFRELQQHLREQA